MGNTPWKVFDHNDKHRISANNATDAALFLYVAGGDGWTVRYREHGRDTRVWNEGKEQYQAYNGNVDVVASVMYARQSQYEHDFKRRADRSYAKFQADMAKPSDPVLIERTGTVGRIVLVERTKKEYGK